MAGVKGGEEITDPGVAALRPASAVRRGNQIPTADLHSDHEVRHVIYTTNAIEALNRQLRKTIKTKGSLPSEEAAIKLIYLAIHNAVPQ